MSTRKLIRAGMVILIAAVAIVVAIRYNVPVLLRDLLEWLDTQGSTGLVVFVATYIAATVLFIPGSILTLGAGFVFGVVGGTLSVSVASTLGASAAFLVGRYVARDWVAAKTLGSPRFAAIDTAVGREGWKIVLLTRLSPVFPFNLLNYAYGLTGVTFPAYFFASWIGMLPGTVMYVYFGSIAANIATLGGATEQRGGLQWLLYALGFAATVAVTVFVTRLSRRALRDTLAEDPADLEGSS